MSGSTATFSAEWLALREPADAAARSDRLEQRLCEALSPDHSRGDPHEDDVIEIVDLGAGTGANLRHLAPRLGGRQAWRLVDHDPAVLSAAERRLHDWAAAQGLTISRGVNARMRLSGRRLDCEAAFSFADLAANLDTLALPPRGLVTASALLDLVSSEWLDTLAERCAAADARVLFALTYDGRIALEPRDPADEHVRVLVNRHQRADKGFGPALGPDAFPAALAAFAQRGYALRFATSDWRLDADQPALQRALIDGWHAAAVELSPAEQLELDAWHRRRTLHIAEGRSRIVVGHADIAGAPQSG